MGKKKKYTSNKYVKDILKGKKFKSCMTCANCIPIGEGDHICDMTNDLVLVEYEPSEYYFSCGGKYYEEN